MSSEEADPGDVGNTLDMYGSALFRNGELAAMLHAQLGRIETAASVHSAQALLDNPDAVAESVIKELSIHAVELDRYWGNVTVAEDEESGGLATLKVPYAGERALFDLRPDLGYSGFPSAVVSDTHVEVQSSVEDPDVRGDLNRQLDEIERWLAWSSQQVSEYNAAVKVGVRKHVHDRATALYAKQEPEQQLDEPEPQDPQDP